MAAEDSRRQRQWEQMTNEIRAHEAYIALLRRQLEAEQEMLIELVARRERLARRLTETDGGDA